MALKSKIEFGDFQTPCRLALDCCQVLQRSGIQPGVLLEPTCGQGHFLSAGLESFTSVHRAVGIEINNCHVNSARHRFSNDLRVEILERSFFDFDWNRLFSNLDDPILVLGNPPWVTNAALSGIGGTNLPRKSNFQEMSGLDALTGKSNFDISEWMLIRICEWLEGRNATLAMLCKTAVARKVLLRAWRLDSQLEQASIYRIDTANHFAAAVDACFLVIQFRSKGRCREASVFDSLDAKTSTQQFGYHNGRLLADIQAFTKLNHLDGRSEYRWRSGVKHDCSKVMELYSDGDRYRNGLGELVELEDTYLYPMLKSSEIANGIMTPTRWMLVTQAMVGEATHTIEWLAPKTWNYLQAHADLFSARGSVIYKNKPQFSIFGIGEYSFSPWKLVISGLYKRLRFGIVGPYRERPIMLDDTGYFIACEAEEEAEHLAALLNSAMAKEFLHSLIFWDSKRPITIDVLGCLYIERLATELNIPSIANKRSVPLVPPMPSLFDR